MNKHYTLVALLALSMGNSLYAAKAYVSNHGSSTVSIVDTTQNAVTGLVTDLVPATFDGPSGIAITPDGTKAYVANNNIDTVSIINVATDKVTGIVTDLFPVTISNPISIVITPNGTKAYVLNQGGYIAPAGVSVIDVATNRVTQTVTGGTFSFPTDMAISPDGSTIYVTNFTNNTVNVISTASNTVTQIVTDNGGTFNGPNSVAFTPDGATAYVANNLSTTVSVINVATNTATLTAIAGFDNPAVVAVSPTAPIAYVGQTSSGPSTALAVINTTSNTLLGMVDDPFSTIANPDTITFTSDGTIAYVNNFNSDGSISVVNVLQDQVTQTVLDSNLTLHLPAAFVIAPAITAASSFAISGVQNKNVFLTQTDYINVISWTVPNLPNLVSYNVYRDAALTQLVGSVTVSPTTPLQIADHNRNPRLSYTYYVVGVSAAGTATLGSVTVLGSFNSVITF